jgi:hypothetical protein
MPRPPLAPNEYDTVAGIKIGRGPVPVLLVLFCLAVIGVATWYVITFRSQEEARFRPSPVTTSQRASLAGR